MEREILHTSTPPKERGRERERERQRQREGGREGRRENTAAASYMRP